MNFEKKNEQKKTKEERIKLNNAWSATHLK